MAKRKFSRKGETPKAYQCCDQKCKWEGTDEEKVEKETRRHELKVFDLTCPECGNNDFYGLLEEPIKTKVNEVPQV
ncbi:MAG: hypothetical protein ACI8WA_000050 [Polaribacter sp.]|jgi:hypothetical protein